MNGPITFDFEKSFDFLFNLNNNDRAKKKESVRHIRKSFGSEIAESRFDVPEGMIAFTLVALDSGRLERAVFFADRRLEKLVTSTPSLIRIVEEELRRRGGVGILARRPPLEVS